MDWSRKRRLSGLTAALSMAWLCLLGAGPAHAKKLDKPTSCRLRCERIEKAAQDEVNQCVSQCPKPRRGNADERQACAVSCNKKLASKPMGMACLDKCESGELDKPKKKASSSSSSKTKTASKSSRSRRR
jgi:hypothetical protein